MKPINLVMSAFGPYKDKVLVDFAKIGNSGIFLITGDTGAGKTTIFDGISFALFGESSGTYRESNSLRSKFASNNTETYVELTFTHKNTEYIITRNPSYLVPKKRGEGFTTKPSDATLTYQNNIITGLKNVNDKIVEILGINAQQFKQISMLAQGEFLKILYSDSNERERIFRKLFNTQILDDITNKLFELQKNNKEELENLKTEFITNANNIDSKDLFIIDKNTLNKETINNTLEKLDIIINENNKDLKKINKDKNNNEKEYKILENEIIKLEENNKNLEQYNILKKEELILINKSTEINIIKDKINKNNNILKEVKPIEITIKSINEDINETNLKINKKLIEINESEEVLKSIIIKETKIEELKSILDLYNIKINELNNNKETLSSITESLNLYKEKNLLDKKYLDLFEEYNKLNKKYIENEDKYFRNQAGILAQKLECNKPCLVCGSLNHPKIATIENSVLTKEELENLKDKVNIKLNEINNIKNNITSINTNINIVNKKIDCNTEIEIKDLNDKINKINLKLDKDIINTKNQFDEIYYQINNNKTNINTFNIIDFINEFNKSNIKLKEEINTNKKLLEEYKVTKNKLEKKLKLENNNILNIIKKLGFKNQTDYINNIINDNDIIELENKVKKHETDIITNKTKLESLVKIISSKEMIDTSLHKERLSKLKEELDILNEESKKICIIYDNNTKIKNKLTKTTKKLNDYMETYSTFEELYKLASGNYKGKRKISFEQYVQATYFDMVLYEANLRFENMTDGRYKLLRKIDANNLNTKFALDLDVFDHYNGSKRDVKSLSGGESFKASLSLALGLSTVIQNYSGGICIDTLFIDEGFGSLDQESINLAINTLYKISDNNKLIGIISHVSELKSNIDKQIIVTKTNQGSNIEFKI